jgi:hypothetical protein
VPVVASQQAAENQFAPGDCSGEREAAGHRRLARGSGAGDKPEQSVTRRGTATAAVSFGPGGGERPRLRRHSVNVSARTARTDPSTERRGGAWPRCVQARA